MAAFPRVTMNKETNNNKDTTETQATTTTSTMEEESAGRLRELFFSDFYRKENWFAELCEILFKVKSRGSSISLELYFGLIHFVSCSYALVVIPQQLVKAGYSSRSSVVTTAICSGVGSMICGLVANLPFVIAPPTVVSIYLVVFLREEALNYQHGNAAVISSGLLLMLFGYKPLTNLVGKLIPLPIQVGTSVGIGLLTALAGALEIKLVQSGQYQILTRGVVSPEVVIAISGVVIISTAIHYHVKGAFCLGLLSCTFVWWIYTGDWPEQIFVLPVTNYTNWSGFTAEFTPPLTADMVFLYVLYLSGIITSLSELGGGLGNNSTPRGVGNTPPRTRWIYVISGIMTVVSGCLCGPPILVSPESAAGIKAGAKTGLSTFVCGLFFLVAVYFADVFQHVPHAGTSPVLLMIGTLLFQNVNRIDWGDIKDAAPAFCVLFFIPFMYSVVEGVTVGYYVYILINLCTGDLLYLLSELLVYYVPCTESYIQQLKSYGYIAKHRSVSMVMDDYNIDVTGIEGRPRNSSRTRASSLNTYQFGPSSSGLDGNGVTAVNPGGVVIDDVVMGGNNEDVSQQYRSINYAVYHGT